MTLLLLGIIAALFLIAWFGLFSGSLSHEAVKAFEFSSARLPGGMKLNYREHGDRQKPTLLLVHGGGDSLSAWDGWAKTLAADFRLVAVDLPGHGLSDPYPDGTYSTERLAVSLKDFVDAIGLKDFCIAGHSFGGETVLRYVVANPHDAKAMVLVAPGGYKAEDGLSVPPAIARLALGPLGKRALRNFWSRPLFGAFQHKNFFFERSALSDAAIDRQFRLLRYAPNRGAMLSLVMNDMAHHRDVTGLNALALPSLFLWGRQDRIVPLEAGRRIAGDVSGSKLKIFEHMGHMLHVERPEESAVEARDFLLGQAAVLRSGRPSAAALPHSATASASAGSSKARSPANSSKAGA